MLKVYDPLSIETRLYKWWEQSGFFQSDPQDTQKPTWSLILPPPNITGSLHMGHAFQDTIMDCLSRYFRMNGHNTLWQPGTDHAGIATQMVVERQLLAENTTKNQLGREKFIEKIWQWKKQSGGNIHQQLRRLGASLDWERDRFTMDPTHSESVTNVFVDLYKQGLIYRGKRLVNWDPKLLSAISDLEVINREEKGFLYHVRYPFVEGTTFGQKHLVIATTRPETILADGALAVNPKDTRYTKFIGKQVWVPMTTRKIPIIADEYVDPSFGSGCVKITPAHDFNDYEVGQRHNMEIINLFTPGAAMNDQVPSAYRGLDRFVARKKIIEDLSSNDLLEKEEPHTYKRPYGDRSNVVIEPYLTDQWFVRTKPLAAKAIIAVQQKRVEFTPKNWENIYFQWLENIQDWCISRQLWWGHRIPVWYDTNNHMYVAETEEKAYQEARKNQYHGELIQDEDVLDTWFSSALWPFSTLGWPKKTAAFKAFYPTSVLVTGFDIIFFWVARMMMFALHFTDEVPFKQVYVHGLVRDKNGEKMSKTKGNVLDPIDIIDGITLPELLQKRTTGLMQPQHLKKIENETRRDYPEGIRKYGCDALRFTLVSMASPGHDIRFDISRCEGYRNFCNKLWNAARFVEMRQNSLPNKTPITDQQQAIITLSTQWIYSRLNNCINNVENSLKDYRFDWMASNLYHFVWHDFCDWYIEMTKPILDTNASEVLMVTLTDVLETICRLSHPIIPFITEEIWQWISVDENAEKTIMLQRYPTFDRINIDSESERKMENLKQLVTMIRRLRSQSNIPPNKKITVYIESKKKENKQLFEQYLPLIISLSNAEICHWVEHSPVGISGTVDQYQITLPFELKTDLEAEIQKTVKHLKILKEQIQVFENKLSKPEYLKKAKPEIIEETQKKQRLYAQNINDLNNRLQQLEAAVEKSTK